MFIIITNILVFVQDGLGGHGARATPPLATHIAKATNKYRRARQRCFWLLAFISRPQVRNIHLPGRMILPGSLIPSDKYFLKNLTFVVRISTRVATSPFQSNSLRKKQFITRSTVKITCQRRFVLNN